MHASICILGNLASFQWLVWGALALAALLGLLAVLWPTAFQKLSTSGSHWVSTDKMLAVFDKQFNVDQYILKHSRLFGLAVLASAVFLAYLFWATAQAP